MLVLLLWITKVLLWELLVVFCVLFLAVLVVLLLFWADVALTELVVVVWVLLITWLLVFVLLFWVVSVSTGAAVWSVVFVETVSFVVGCSTSMIRGEWMGTDSALSIGKAWDSEDNSGGHH